MDVDTSDIERLEDTISRLGDMAEETVNKILHGEGAEMVKKDLTRFVPVSQKSKVHAKSSDPWNIKDINLGLQVKTRLKFHYLVFPDEGRGIRNPVKQDFTGQGLEKAQPSLIQELQQKIIQEIEGVF